MWSIVVSCVVVGNVLQNFCILTTSNAKTY